METRSQLLESLPVVSVQELVKEQMSEVPENYVCVQPKAVVNDGEMSTTILPTLPTISMKHLLSVDKTLSAKELEKLHLACRDWGFFQLVSHGISSSLLEKLRHEIEEFFKLPLQDKLKYAVRQGDYEGYGPNPVASEKKLDWGDRFFMIINPLARRKPHLFPQLPPSLRDTMETYIQEMQSTAMQLLLLLCKCLGIDMKEITDLFGGDDGLQTLRMTYYPPCPRPELVLGLTPHSDGSAITILNQINGVDGLHVNKDGTWIPVSITADAFAVNIGDIMEILSNGIYKSIEHKVTVNSEKERMSIALFFDPKLESEIGPSPSIVNPNNPALFRRLQMEEYLKGFFSQRLSGKSYLEKLRIGGTTSA